MSSMVLSMCFSTTQGQWKAVRLSEKMYAKLLAHSRCSPLPYMQHGQLPLPPEVPAHHRQPLS